MTYPYSAQSNSIDQETSGFALKKNQEQLKTKRYIRKLYYCLITSIVVISLYLISNAPTSVSASKLILALLIFWISLFPGLHYLKNSDRPSVPFFPLVGLFYASTFGLPIFLSDDVSVFNVSDLGNVSHYSLLLTLAGISSLIYSFYEARYTIWKNIQPIKISESYSLNRLLILTWLALLSHFAYMYISFFYSIPSIGYILNAIGIVSYGIFYLIWAENKLPLIQAVLLTCFCFPTELFIALASGALAQVILIVLFMFLVFWYKHQRISIILAVFLISFYLIFNPIKGQYRSLAWSGAYSNESLITKGKLFIELAINNREEQYIDEEAAVNSNISRIANIAIFSKVVDDTPRIVPYWNGKSYLSLFTKFIPRIIWSNKPEETIGVEFGQRYHFISHFNNQTSVNLPWLVELYANFGGVGVLIGMSFFGILLALIDRVFNGYDMNLVEIVLGISVTVSLILQESNFSLMIGRAFLLGVGLYCIARFLLGNRLKSGV